MINKLFGTFTAKVAVVALAGGFATGGLAAAGAFTGSGHTDPAPITVSSPAAIGASTTATADPDDHSATATVKTEPEENPSPTATVSPKPEPSPEAKESDADDSVTGTVEADDTDDAGSNHGNCVSFAASIVKSLGLTGEQNGAFISLVARDKTAVTAKVAAGGTPDAACLTALAKAKAAALAVSVTGTVDDHGKDDATHDTRDDHSGDTGKGSTTTITSATTTAAKGGDDPSKGGHH